MTHINIAGRIKYAHPRQTGTLGEALKAKLAEQEQNEPTVTLTLRPSPHSDRILFHLEIDNLPEGNLLRSGIFYGIAHATAGVTDLLAMYPNATVIRKKLEQGQ